MYSHFFKRFFDIVLSGLALIVLAPLLGVLAVMVKVKLGSPVLFCQERPGKKDRKSGKEKIFKLYKFRTMTDERDEEGNLLSDEVRLTKFGKILRSTSLDELPELWNIFKGDMAIVGPRPLLIRYIPLYSEEERQRHDVRPGLTGYAQTCGRNAISWKEKFEHDIFYVKHVSLGLDLTIILKTFLVVFKREGISAEGTTSMEEYKKGNEY